LSETGFNQISWLKPTAIDCLKQVLTRLDG
jgi:hypothetical protein